MNNFYFVLKVFREGDLPLLVFKDHQKKLSVLTSEITEATADFVQAGFQKVCSVLQLFG